MTALPADDPVPTLPTDGLPTDPARRTRAVLPSGDRLALVASDLDGTLLHSDLSISDRTRAAVAAVEDAGLPFVIVTGRPIRWLRVAADELGHRGVAVAANGALLYDLHTESVVERFPLVPEIGAAIVRALREALPGAAFAAERETGFGCEPSYRPLHAMDADAVVGAAESLVEEPVLKLLVRHGDFDSDGLMERARAAIGDAAVVTHSFGPSGLVEISASGISKATTLARVCAERGVAQGEVVAFGDMPNDLPLMEWAGHGVAVANAHPEVLDAADEVTASNDDDGVARVIERLLG